MLNLQSLKKIETDLPDLDLLGKSFAKSLFARRRRRLK
jgi:hypothetical protein